MDVVTVDVAEPHHSRTDSEHIQTRAAANLAAAVKRRLLRFNLFQRFNSENAMLKRQCHCLAFRNDQIVWKCVPGREAELAAFLEPMNPAEFFAPADLLRPAEILAPMMNLTRCQ